MVVASAQTPDDTLVIAHSVDAASLEPPRLPREIENILESRFRHALPKSTGRLVVPYLATQLRNLPKWHRMGDV